MAEIKLTFEDAVQHLEHRLQGWEAIKPTNGLITKHEADIVGGELRGLIFQLRGAQKGIVRLQKPKKRKTRR